MTPVTTHRVCLPLRVPVGGMTGREAVLVEGPAGWGEFSPFPGYPTDDLSGRAAAGEGALQEWPTPVRSTVAVNALIPAVEPDRAAALTVEALAVGVTVFKVKVGAGDDLGRLSAVRDAAGPSARLRIDPNGVWDLETAQSELDRFGRFDLELVEQPVATLEDLAALRRRTGVPLAADESVRTVDDAKRLAALDAADAVVLKVQVLGGVRSALRVADAAGVPAVVSSMLETSVGLAAGLALAAVLPELPFACGLGTGLLLDGDVVADPLVPEGGVLRVRRPEPTPDLLEQFACAPT